MICGCCWRSACLNRDRRRAVFIVLHVHIPGTAADLAILDILLLVAAAGVERDAHELAAPRAGNLGVGVEVAGTFVLVVPVLRRLIVVVGGQEIQLAMM